MNKSSTESTRTKNYFAEMLWDLGEKLVFVSWHGLVHFVKRFMSQPLSTIAILVAGYLGIRFIAYRAYHLKFLNWIWPSLFSGKFLDWIYHFGASGSFKFLLISFTWLYVIALGAKALRGKRKFKEKFEAIGLVNRFGEAPLLIKQYHIDEYREFFLLNAKSIGIDQFESKRQSIEAAFGKKLDNIKVGHDLRNVEIVFNSKELPNWVSFQELIEKKPIEEEHFIIGESASGILSGKLSTFPHLLIAGTTGAGKSVFFKQTILGLLRSTDHLQVYFIDLKKGLEASDFMNTPNVAIAKDPIEALLYLEKVQEEMNKRFKFLENKNCKSIEPKRDKKDRIIVAVDEAAELYAEKSRTDEDYEVFKRAQEITNSIARLGRAAGIHLILATQKVNKESINTNIQENISVRMCFRMNTLQGSLQVLGNKDALELSSIPGRGIFQHSNKQTEVQVPFINGYEIQGACQEITLEFQDGRRKLLQPMLGKPAANVSNEFRESFVN